MPPISPQHARLLRQTLGAFHPIPDGAIDEILALMHTRQLAKGEVFVRDGEIARDMGFVVEGLLRACHRTSLGEEYNKTFFPSGTFVMALSSLITGQPNRIVLDALLPSTLLVLDYRRFLALLDRHPALERFTRLAVEREWVKKEEREIRLVQQDAESRYRHFLTEHPGLIDRIPLYHIASYLGVTPVHLSRIRARVSVESAT